MGAIAQEDVLDLGRVEAGALHGVLQGVCGHGDGGRDVEPPTAGLRQTRSRVGDDDGFTHHEYSPEIVF
jgi:hypothetical protein